MRASTLFIASLNALSAAALPLVSTEAATLPATSQLTTTSRDSTAYDWQKGYVSEFPIHSSCNSTERRELTEALRQTVEMAEQAKNHSKSLSAKKCLNIQLTITSVLVHGNKSPIFIKYFGEKGATAVPMGWYQKVVSGNRDGLLFRCDDIDRNCATQDRKHSFHSIIASKPDNVQNGPATGEEIMALERPSYALFHTQPVSRTYYLPSSKY